MKKLCDKIKTRIRRLNLLEGAEGQWRKLRLKHENWDEITCSIWKGIAVLSKCSLKIAFQYSPTVNWVICSCHAFMPNSNIIFCSYRVSDRTHGTLVTKLRLFLRLSLNFFFFFAFGCSNQVVKRFLIPGGGFWPLTTLTFTADVWVSWTLVTLLPKRGHPSASSGTLPVSTRVIGVFALPFGGRGWSRVDFGSVYGLAFLPLE